MHNMTRLSSRFVAGTSSVARFLCLALLWVAACQPAPPAANVRLAVSVPSAVTRVTVTVTGPGIQTPLSFNLEQSGTTWGGVLGNIPAGSGRTFAAQAVNSAGAVLFAGSATGVTITANQTLQLAITLLEVPAHPSINNATPVISSLSAPTEVVPGGSITLSAVATDPEGDTLQVAWSGAPADGSFSSTTALSTTYTAPSTEGVVTLTLTVRDSHNASAAITIQINVQRSGGTGAVELLIGFNNSPQVTDIQVSQGRIAVNQSTQVTAVANDADNDSLSYTWSADCAGSLSSPSSATTQFTPTALPAGTCNNCRLTVRVRDARGAENTGTLALCIANDTVTRYPPVITQSFQTTTRPQPGQTITLEVVARDPQASALSFTWNATAGTLGTAQTSADHSRISWTVPSCLPSGVTPVVTATVSNAYGMTVTQTFPSTGSAIPACPTSPPLANRVLELRGTDFGGLTLNPNATISGTQSRFYGSSMYFPTANSGGYIAAPAYTPGTGDFLTQAWVFIPTLVTLQVMFGFGNSGSNYYHCGVTADGSLYLQANGGNRTDTYSAPGILTPNQWHHVRVSRVSGEWAVFLDGIRRFGVTNPGDISAGNTVRIGCEGAYVGSYALQGYMNDFEHFVGVGSLADYSPPTTPIP